MKQFLVIAETRVKSLSYIDDFDNYDDAVARIQYLDKVATRQENAKSNDKYDIVNIIFINRQMGEISLTNILL